MTHAVEAYVSTLHCPFTDPLALQRHSRWCYDDLTDVL